LDIGTFLLSFSTNWRFSSTETAEIFFKPFVLHLELPYLPIQLRFYLVPLLIRPLPPVRKQLRQDDQQMLFPLTNLIAMDPIFTTVFSPLTASSATLALNWSS